MVKACESCKFLIEDLEVLIEKSKKVQLMFDFLQKREEAETLSTDDLNKARMMHQLEEIIEDASEVYLTETEDAIIDEDQDYFKDETFDEEDMECVNYEEIIYEDEESPAALDEIEPTSTGEEHLEYFPREPLSSSKKNLPLKEGKVNDEDSFNFACHICETVFDQMYSLSNHTREAHQALPKVACSCGRFLSTWDSLMAHKRKHNPASKSFNCNFCNLSFRTKPGLSIHIKFKHEKPAKAHSCDICSREFKDNNTLKHHIRTHLNDEEKYAFECHICGKKVVNKYSLKHHIEAIHEGRKKHFCHLCGKSFANKSNLRSHLISHTTENVICNICGGKFKNLISLQSHKKLHKNEARIFPCQKCEKTFYNRNHLARHMSAHTDEKMFKCDHAGCDNEYKWEKDLKNHIIGVHSGEILILDCPLH